MQTTTPPQPKKSRSLLIIFLIALLLALAAGAYTWFFMGRVIFEGHLSEKTLSLSFDVTGNVLKVHVREGDAVQPGQVLITLQQETLQRELVAAQATLANYELLLPTSRRQAPDQGEFAETMDQRVERQRQEEDLAERWLQDFSDNEAHTAITYNRARLMLAKGTLSPADMAVITQEYETAKAALQNAKSGFEARSLARASTSADVRRIRAMQEEVGANDIPEAVRIANYEQQKQKLKRIGEQLAATVLKAPSNGIVTGIAVESGAAAIAGQACITLAPFASADTVIGSVDTATAAKLKRGQACSVDLAGATGNPYKGWISTILPASPLRQGDSENSDKNMQVYVLLESTTELTEDGAPAVIMLPGGTKAEVTVMLRESLFVETAPAVPASVVHSVTSSPGISGQGTPPMPTPVMPPPVMEQPAPVLVPADENTVRTSSAREEARAPAASGTAVSAPVVLTPATGANTSAEDTLEAKPLLPPMKAPKKLVGTGLPSPGNNPSLVTPDALRQSGWSEPRHMTTP